MSPWGYHITNEQLEELRRLHLRAEWFNVLGFALLGLGCGCLPLLWFLPRPGAWVWLLGQGALVFAMLLFWRVVKLKRARAAIIEVVRESGP